MLRFHQIHSSAVRLILAGIVALVTIVNGPAFAAGLQRAEYFFDDPDVLPGAGETLSGVGSIAGENQAEFLLENLDISSLAEGEHVLYVRVQDDEGNWGILRQTRFNVYAAPDAIKAAEYFFDEDPGQGNGTVLTAVDGTFDHSVEEAQISIVPELSEGVHTLYVRFRNALNLWSTPSKTYVAVNRPMVNTLTTPAQGRTDDGRIPVSVDVTDSNGYDCTLQVAYTRDNGTTWSRCTLDPETLTATHGTPDVDNAQAYQIGNQTPIVTANGVNHLEFIWLSRQDLPDTDIENVQLKFTVDNGQTGQSTSTTTNPFDIDNQGPDAPVLNLYTPDPTGAKRPFLTWKDAKAAVGYRIQIATDPGFTQVQVDDATVVDPEYKPGADLAMGTVYWRVCSIDGQGNQSVFSTIDSFTIIEDNTAPAVELTYSNPSPVSAGPLVITARFSEPLASVPQISIARPGNESITAAMEGSASLWSYTYEVLCSDGTTLQDGETTVTITNGLDAAGNENTAASNNIFTIDTTACGTDVITEAEYFFDHDPGQGNGIPVDAADGSFNEAEEEISIQDLSVDELTTGSHTVYVRFKSADGQWGLARPVNFDSLFSGAHNFIVERDKWIGAAEYYIDSDPGIGNGTALEAADGTFDSNKEELTLQNIDISHLMPGPHTLYIRVQDNEGSWGILCQTRFNVYDASDIITAAEYFFDEDPGKGFGTELPALDGDFNSPEEEAQISGVDVSGLSEGTHTLYVRFRNALGLWSAPMERVIGINRPVADTFTTPVQNLNDDGRIAVSVDVSDSNEYDCSLKVEYSLDNGTTWSRCTLEPSSLSATYGAPDVDNAKDFQIGTQTPIVTANGVNHLDFIWLSRQDLPDTDIENLRLKFTVDNGQTGQSTSSITDPFDLDNQDPDAPVINIYLPDPTGTRRPVLTWQDAKAAKGYHIQIASDQTFSQMLVDDNTVVDPRYQPEADLPMGTVFWRVRSLDSQGNQSVFSTIDSFTIVEDSTVPAVELAYSEPSPVSAGPLVITALFSEPLASTPQISISRPGSESVTAAMDGSCSLWSYTYDVLCSNGTTLLDGDTTVTISNGMDSAGNTNTPAANAVFEIDTSACGTGTITAAEYFFDHDPGQGNGVPVEVSGGTQQEIIIQDLSVDELTTGPHTVYVRFKNSDGQWGLARPVNFDSMFSGPHNFIIERDRWIVAAEYYIDSDPGLGQGEALGAADGVFDSPEEDLVLQDIDISHIMPGPHTLHIRVQDNEGTWGILRRTQFFVYEQADIITAGEYYFDSDPGEGLGTSLPAADGTYDGPEETAQLDDLDISSLSDGVHTLYLRFLNALGRWSAPVAQPIGINRPIAYAKFGTLALDENDKLPLTVIVEDSTDANCLLKVDFSLDDSGIWHNIAIEEGSLTAGSGAPALDNTADYQIGEASSPIDTASGPNELKFNWLVDTSAFSGATEISLRFTVDNGTYTTFTQVQLDSGLNEFIDTTPPVISALKFNNVLLTPESILTQPGSFTFLVSDADSDMGRVLFYIDGKLVSTFIGKSGLLTHEWDISAVDDGFYTITIEAYDKFGNMARHTLSNLEVGLTPPPSPSTDTNLDGLIISRNTLTLTGTATPNTYINVYNNGVLVARNVAVDGSGKFTVAFALTSGENSIQISAENRSGEGELSGAQVVTYDPDALRPPLGFEANSKPLGVIRLTWGQPLGEIPAGYNIYRSQTAFFDESEAELITDQPVTRLYHEDLPEAEGTWYYRAVSVDSLGNESEMTTEQSAVSDAVDPWVTQVTYTTDGVYDETEDIFGPGTITVTLSVSEALNGTPFFSLNIDQENPVPITLTQQDETTWSGSFSVEAGTMSGIFYAVFSGKDKAGNSGTIIEAGDTLNVDAQGPAVTVLDVNPVSPIKNSSEDPAQVTVTLSLNEVVKEGTVPEISYLLSGEGSDPLPVENLTEITTLSGQAQTWQGSFVLPADAGAGDGESFAFSYQGADAWDNVGSAIMAANSFQVYQGNLPPLPTPTGLVGQALPGGQIKLLWNPVKSAAGYALYRQGPGDAALELYQRLDLATEYIDTPAEEGDYSYAVASVREMYDEEALSGYSAMVTVISDATAPGVPQNLSLDLLPTGISALWDGVADNDALTYRLYRSGQAEITTVSGLTPVVADIDTNEALDTHPSNTHHTYAVTAVDPAGNESAPSPSVYLDFELLPVTDIAVVQNNDENPVVTWRAEGSSIAGFDIYLGKGTDGVKLNTDLLTSPIYTDEGYSNDERTYTVVAVNTDGHESLGRTIVLPKVTMALQEDETLSRNLINQLSFQVENLSSSTIEDAILKLDVDTYTDHESDIFELSSRQSALIPVVVGGYADLPAYADYSLSLVSTPNPGETVTITRTGQIDVVNDTLVAGMLSDNWIRGGTAQVWFTLDNTGEAAIEIITAEESGADASPDIRVQLTDTDGNILSESQLKQSQGENMTTLSDGTSIARIDAGSIFTSAAIDLPVPVNAPDDVNVILYIDQVYHGFGEANAIVLAGLTTRTGISVSQPPYTGEILSIDPIESDGSENITIIGQALARETGAPVPLVPIKLVIYQDGFEKSYNVYTGNDGQFIYTYYPSDSEYGTYQVRAVHPAINHGVSQGEFSIQRVGLTPDNVNLNLIHNHPKTVAVSVLGGFDTPANNLRLEYRPGDQSGGDLPQGVSVDLPPAIAILEPQTTEQLTVSIWGDDTVDSSSRVVLNLASDENPSWGKLTLNLYFSEAQPSLYFSPNYVETGLAVDDILSERITLENQGTDVMRNLFLSVLQQDGAPAPDWVVLNSSSTLGDLAVGEAKDVDISFAPKSGISEGIYQFMLRVTADNHATTDINLFVSVTRSGTGHVLFRVSDIYTGTIDPDTDQEVAGLSGAKITIQNENVLSIEETLTTNAQGEALFSDLSAGLYKCRITVGDHQQYTGRFWIKPGITVTRDIFLDYNLVSVEWKVVETTIQDQYTIELNYVFETQVEVPAAVLTIEPASTHLPDMQPGDVYNGEITIINHGLIQAENMTYTPPSDNQTYKYEFFGEVPDILPAKSSFTLPFRVTRVSSTTDDGSGGALTRCNINIDTGRTAGIMVCINGTLRPVGATNEFVDSGEWCNDFVEGPGGGGGGGNTIYTSMSGEQIHCEDNPDECPQDDDYQCCCQEKKTCANVGSSVNLLSGKYVYHDTDFSISVPGHSISTTRRYHDGAWHFNHTHNRLDIDLDEGPVSTSTIYKDGVAYEETESGSNLFSYKDKYFIQPEADGYRWNDRKGNWQTFDADGKALAYGDRYNQSVKYLYDTANTDRLVGLSDTNDRQVLWYEYQGDHISAVEDIAGRRISYTYDGDNLVDVTDVMGNHWGYTYDSGGRLTSKTTPLGGTTSISYYGDGFVKSVTTSTGASKYFDYSYNSGTREYYAQITHSSGMVDERWYNSKGKAIKKAINGVVQKSISYNDNIRTSVASGGQQTEEELDQWEQVTKTTYADGSSVSSEYDPKSGSLLRQTNELGVVTKYDYDENDNMIRMTEAVGTDVERITEYAYDDVGRLIETRQLGDAVTAEAVSTMTYDADGNVATQTDPEGGVTQYIEYDALSNVLQKKDARDKLWQYSYDKVGQLLSVTDPLDYVTRYEYDAAGNQTKVIDANGHATNYTFDKHGRMTTMIDAEGGITRYEYDQFGQQTKVIDAEGKITVQNEYDDQGRLIRTIDGNDNVIESIYVEEGDSGCSSCNAGDQGRLVATVYPTFERHYLYDQRERKISDIDVLSEKKSQTISYEYDTAGNRVKVVDKGGRKTTYEYDALNRMVATVNALGGRTEYSYDSRNNMIALCDANRNTTSFEYNLNNRLIKEIRPQGEQVTYAYDAASNLTEKTDAQNQKTVLVYDNAGRHVKTIYYANSSYTIPVKNVSFTYDANGNLLSYDDSFTFGQYNYDVKNRKTSEIVDYGKFTLKNTYEYNKNDTRKSFTGPDNITYTYHYDSANQLIGIEIPEVGTIIFSSFTWNRPGCITYPGGTIRKFDYDSLMRLIQISSIRPDGQTIMDHVYSYDAVSNIITKATEHGLYKYDYDSLYRLVSVDNPDFKDEDYSYDPIGNRLSSTGVLEPYEYNENNELITFSDYKLFYDNHGSQIRSELESDVIKYQYNVENRLESIEDASGLIISNYFDPFGRRLKKSVGQNITYYIYNNEGLVGEFDKDGRMKTSYHFKPESYWSTDPVIIYNTNGDNSNQIYFYHNDLIGTPQKICRLDGTTVWSSKYNSFGRTIVDLEMIENNLRLPGQYYDSQADLNYNYRRFYNPSIGRYISIDPLGIDSNENYYIYAENNPISFFDPLGLESTGSSSFCCNDERLKKIIAYHRAMSACYLKMSKNESIHNNSNYIYNNENLKKDCGNQFPAIYDKSEIVGGVFGYKNINGPHRRSDFDPDIITCVIDDSYKNHPCAGIAKQCCERHEKFHQKVYFGKKKKKITKYRIMNAAKEEAIAHDIQAECLKKKCNY